MAIIIGEVVANITGDPAKFEQAMDGVKRSGEQAITGIENRFKKLTSDIGAQGRVLSRSLTAPLLAIGGALFGATVRASNFADEIDKMSIRSGVSRQRLQELRFVTDQVGVEFGAVEQAADGLRRRLLQIEEGSGRSAEVFGRLGVSIRGADGQMRSMDELMPDVIASLAEIENETERSALAMQVFGRSASNLAPLLAQGEAGIEALTARAHELGLVMGDEAIGDMVQFKDQMAEVQQQAGAVAREFGMVLMPIIKNDLIPIIRDQLVPAIRSAAKFFSDLDDGTKKTAITIAALAASAGPVMMAVGAVAKLTLGIKALSLAMLANPYTAIGVGLLALAVYATQAKSEVDKLADSLLREIDPDSLIDAEDFAKTIDNVRDQLVSLYQERERTERSLASRPGGRLAVSRELEAIDKQIQAYQRVLIEVARLRDAQSDNAEETETVTDAVERLAVASETIRPIRLLDPNAGFEMVEVEESLKRLLGIADDAFDLSLADRMFPPGSLGAIREEINAINHEMQFLTDPEAVKALNLEIEQLQKEMNKLAGVIPRREIGEFELMAIRATESFTKGLADSLIFGGKLKDTLNDIIKQLASRALQQFLMIALTGGTGGAAQGLGGVLGRVFGVGDALIRSNGDVVQFHPNDNLMAWQGANMPSGGGKSLSLTIPIQVDGRTVWEANRNFEIDL